MPLDWGGFVPLRVSRRTEMFPSIPPLRVGTTKKRERKTEKRRRGVCGAVRSCFMLGEFL